MSTAMLYSRSTYECTLVKHERHDDKSGPDDASLKNGDLAGIGRHTRTCVFTKTRLAQADPGRRSLERLSQTRRARLN